MERPASIVRELVQNARRRNSGLTVTARWRTRGRERRRQRRGLNCSDALMSIERHATSKITKTEDLNEIGTLGFRGRRRRLSLQSATSRCRPVRGAEEGHRLSIDGGTGMSSRGCPEHSRRGHKAFHNLPARQKFLRRRETDSTTARKP